MAIEGSSIFGDPIPWRRNIDDPRGQREIPGAEPSTWVRRATKKLIEIKQALARRKRRR